MNILLEPWNESEAEQPPAPSIQAEKAVPYPKSAKTTKGRKENQKLPLFLG